MKEVGNTTVGALPRVEGYNFRERARTLVEKWKPLLLADVHKRHWMRQGPTTLEYVPDCSGKHLYIIYSSLTSHKLTTLFFSTPPF